MAKFRFIILLSVMTLGAAARLAAQTLTPGAAAIGGTTGSGDLIAPGGGSVSPSLGAPGLQTGSDGRRLHYPLANWVLSNPPIRTQVRGTEIASLQGDANDVRSDGEAQPAPSSASGSDADSAVSSVDPVTSSDGDLSPVFVPSATQTPDTQTPDTQAITAQEPSDEAAQVSPSDATASAPPTASTATVTAGATDETAPSPGDEALPLPTADALGAPDFEMASLPFGISDTELTQDHIFRLEPVIALMRAQPTTPLNVVAIIPQADGDNEDVKLLARKRILAVRRYILSQGVSSDRLSFKITATAATEQFANHVLIQR